VLRLTPNSVVADVDQAVADVVAESAVAAGNGGEPAEGFQFL
jgi:hypothetical protein